MTNILALDLGTNTGWALLQQNRLDDIQQHRLWAGDKGDDLAGAADKANYLVTSGTISFKNDRFQGGGMRYLKFRNWLAEVHAMQTAKHY